MNIHLENLKSATRIARKLNLLDEKKKKRPEAEEGPWDFSDLAKGILSHVDYAKWHYQPIPDAVDFELKRYQFSLFQHTDDGKIGISFGRSNDYIRIYVGLWSREDRRYIEFIEILLCSDGRFSVEIEQKDKKEETKPIMKSLKDLLKDLEPVMERIKCDEERRTHNIVELRKLLGVRARS